MADDPADKALQKTVDGQTVIQHNLKDRIEWEKHQANKAVGGWNAVGKACIRTGGPAPEPPK